MNRTEYPRPQFVRDKWTNLNGEWLFMYDDQNVGVENKWQDDPSHYQKTIQVPFVYQSAESGIGDRTPHDIVWYMREFEVSYSKYERVLLHFGAVDYEADIYINGQHVKNHIGGHTSFEVDITHQLLDGGPQRVAVRAYDRHDDESTPRGKQFWEAESAAIWYTNSTGIWQTVWLEVVQDSYLQKTKLVPRFDAGKIDITAEVNQVISDLSLAYEITFGETAIAAGTAVFTEAKVVFEVELFQEHIFRTNFHNNGWSWTPENPQLFDIRFTLKQKDRCLDTVNSYFGMRKIHTENGMVYLNNKPYYQKLVLDQGYWPSGLLTAPTDEAFQQDILLAKEMGFNGCRKHQKTEDPRFLYWADRLGFLVWGECAAPAIYNERSVSRLMHEWTEIIDRDSNHPSIVTWVPINESWGVPAIGHDRQQQHFSQAMYHYIHSIDPTRLVISNDGWAMTETDICALHNYSHGTKEEPEKYDYFKKTLSTRENLVSRMTSAWPVFAKGFAYQDQPILLTEFGGIGFDVSGQPGWGYTSADNETDFLKDYQRIMTAVYQSVGLWGYCYTQITDVEQEINGLLTYDRQPKVPLAAIKKINDQFHAPQVD
ncbi:glycoside hydrolase family 2 TIM barrel-domain containing protein [Enterococcus sp.]|uniref:glycoside hydrolase family 2 protein n=1 Tax=Enterococcus sp. TaxID=35783 RepID=UPI000EECA6DD|nr:glycoside hydrolase family 2 TIM barrel-domain containing protein [Enterococcus sp.]HCE13441.1 glycoside hydrolase family 2 [Enterococcus sp.]